MNFIIKFLTSIILILFLSSSANASLKMINLICYMNDPNSPLGSPHQIKIYPDKKYFRLPEYNMAVSTLKVSQDFYYGKYEMGVNVEFYIDRNTGGITYVLSDDYRKKYHEGFCKKSSEGQKF
tara:strand:+ start:527 stop:895 length:369 start_codon:yes stop_codon:yes gene_type:complete